MMKRDDCFRALARRLGNEIVCPVYSSAFDWLEIAPRALNYYTFGAMGLGSSHALGLALGCPDRRVIVLDGDGSLLMNLGTLVTIGAAAPTNLIHFVCRNGTYEANGGHPIPQPDVDFGGLARAAGYAQVADFHTLAAFEAALPQLLARDGPSFAVLHVEKGALSPEFNYRTLEDPNRSAAFRAALRG
ncbi:MAG: thiamine pyrophosphate-binding protein [Hyphomicrobiales bacterium]|nr:thiamine pyrophosphate-binding protein [Hyphomicrobiales bacterium]